MNIIVMTSNICCFFFLIFLTIIYVTKKNIKNEENRIYKWIVINNFLLLVIELIFALTAYYFYNNLFLIMFIEKIYFMYVLVWMLNFTYYILMISNEKSKSILHKNHKINIFVLIILLFIIGVVMSFLPIDHVYNGKYISYASGVAPTFMAAIAVIMILICVFTVIKNRKKLNKKKVVPIFVFLGLEVIFSVVNSLYPSIVLNSLAITLISYLMYHTIENPDVKLINQLELAKDSAEKANHAKTDFLSSMSHEIRTPLNAIVGFSQCIENASNLEEAKEDARDIVMASQNLLEIVNGILDISKIEADKMEIVNTEYNLKEILNNLTKLIKARIGEKDIELKTNFAVDLPDRLYGDSGKVKQIITNILTNAAKYTEQGEIEFTVNCLNNQDKSKLIISIRDTGRGIKQEQIDKLFNKFERLDEDKNTTTEGTGLGLAITKRLVEMMGGKIVVQSEYGEGSIFTVYLTQDIRNGLYEKEEVVEEVISFDNKKVLIVDDNKLNIKVGTKILREYNLDISSAQSGFECINKIENNEKFDIILLDIMMPKMSGVETLKRLKQIEGFNTPVIALTADAIQGREKKYLEVGFNGYLSKPIDPIELNQVLSKYLSYKEEIKKEQKKLEDKVNKLNVEFLEENDIDVDSSLELLGDMDMYNDTLKDFLTESETRLPKMKEHLSGEDASNYAILAHAMKSDSKYLGFKKLAELSLDHELKGKENNIEYIKDHYEELMNEVERIINVAKEYLGDE